MRYDVVLVGLRGRAPVEVGAEVAKIFGVDLDAGTRIAGFRDRTIRRGVDLETAATFKRTLEPLGFELKVEPQAESLGRMTRPATPQAGAGGASATSPSASMPKVTMPARPQSRSPSTTSEPSVPKVTMPAKPSAGARPSVDEVSGFANTLLPNTQRPDLDEISSIPPDQVSALTSETMAFGSGVDGVALDAAANHADPFASSTKAYSESPDADSLELPPPTAGELELGPSSPHEFQPAYGGDGGVTPEGGGELGWTGLDDMPSLDLRPDERPAELPGLPDLPGMPDDSLSALPPLELDESALPPHGGGPPDVAPAAVAGVLTDMTVKGGGGAYAPPPAAAPAAPAANRSAPAPARPASASAAAPRGDYPAPGQPYRVGGGGPIGTGARNDQPQPTNPFYLDLLLAWIFPFTGGIAKLGLTIAGIALVGFLVGIIPLLGGLFSILFVSGLVLGWFFGVIRWSGMGAQEFGMFDGSSFLSDFFRYIAVFIVAAVPSGLVIWRLDGGAEAVGLMLTSILAVVYLPAGMMVAAYDNGATAVFNPTAVLEIIRAAPGSYFLTTGALWLWSMVFGVSMTMALPAAAAASAGIPFIGGFVGWLIVVAVMAVMLTVGGRMIGLFVWHHEDELGMS